ncbi:MAG: 16S rRNA (adenine(1518)-N(6)/adenine(1519)-N(6))-dimethyltransferase RsmA [Clostridia bacterium]|nr:16S rRNA (adenine(1518)-N(6)/adenine(1519)-N(6))-dimethyltransferase RsmA [Clostridia bacterium]
MNLCDVKTVKDIMAMFGLNFQKKFGQNFLVNRSVVEDIADNCCDDADSTILEIGPGIGTLTRELAQRYKNLVALEIDRGFIPVLGYTLGEFNNTAVINEDVMKADIEKILAPYFEKGKVSVCANLPYYITTPILMKLLDSGLPFDYITIMIQSEVANRLCAKAGTRDYGAITAVLGYYGEAERLFKVEPYNFVPPPKVTSAIVRIKLYKDKPYKPLSEDCYFKTVKAAFEQRRKTLPNALSAFFADIDKEKLTQAVIDCGFSADIRGERLDVGDFCRLSDSIYQIRQER